MYFLFSQLYSAIRSNISKNLILEKNFYPQFTQRKINIGIFFHFWQDNENIEMNYYKNIKLIISQSKLFKPRFYKYFICKNFS